MISRRSATSSKIRATSALSKMSLLVLSPAPGHLQELLFRERGDAEGSGLQKLRTGRLPHDHEIGVAADASGRAAAQALDQGLGLLARQRVERPGEDDRLPPEGPRGPASGRDLDEGQPAPQAEIDDAAVRLCPEEIDDTARRGGADALHPEERRLVRASYGLEAPEVGREVARGAVADARDAEGVQEAPQFRPLRGLDGAHQVARRHLSEALEPGEIRLLQREQIGDAPHEAVLDELLDRLRTQARDVERPPRAEVPQGATDLRGAAEPVRAAVEGAVPYRRRAALGAGSRHDERPAPPGSAPRQPLDDL